MAATFRKAKAEQAALKMSMYGPPGSGKTFTALLLAEGLAAACGRRVAFVDTERGTDFYALAVPERKAHPAAFDFDALYTKSLTEVLAAVRSLDPATHGVVIIDSVSHLWDSAVAAFGGRRNRAGQIPMHAWPQIKRPYKELMALLLNSPMHALILGRQANAFEDDAETGEAKAAGFKMRAEGETQYEPHVCVRMASVRPAKGRGAAGLDVPTAFVEKDRSGKLHGLAIEWPTFDSLARPLLGLLGGQQARVQGEDEAAELDGAEMARREDAARSRLRREQVAARLAKARTLGDVQAVAEAVTPDERADLLADDSALLRAAFRQRREELAAPAGQQALPVGDSGPYGGGH